MTANGWLQIGIYLIVLLPLTKPMDIFMTRVLAGENTFLDPALRPFERLLLSAGKVF
jgi:K+-transporting ATPase ATPase A chain